jgi:SAM-dependent methyltransferase
MWIDAERLSHFYQTKLGNMVQQQVIAGIAGLWPTVKGDVVVGYGYCAPYLRLFDGEAERILQLMPAPQGASHWPKGKPNLTALVEEFAWPLRDKSVDRLILCHALEFSYDAEALLQECWRVLSDHGELLIIVPNRRSAWAQTTSTPLGFGTPYTGHQLYDVLENAGFAPQKPKYCLYAPPSNRVLNLRLSAAFEKYGPMFSKKWGGMLLFPAKKQIYALTPRRQNIWLPKALHPTTV